MKVSDLTDGMETLSDLFRRAKDADAMENLSPSEVLLLTRAYAQLTWAMGRAFESASEKTTASHGDVVRQQPFKEFTHSLWMTREDASRLRERMVDYRGVKRAV